MLLATVNTVQYIYLLNQQKKCFLNIYLNKKNNLKKVILTKKVLKKVKVILTKNVDIPTVLLH